MTLPAPVAVSTPAWLDGLGRVAADALDVQHGRVYAVGVTKAVTGPERRVVPQAEDFGDSDLPAIVLALGSWSLIPGPLERRTHEVMLSVWRPRVPLGEVYPKLLDDLDRLAAVFAMHSRAYLVEPALKSVVIMGGEGVEERAVGRGEGPARLFLVLPVRLEAKVEHVQRPRPA